MKTVYDESRNAFTLGEQLARGGQGVVWRLAGNNNYLVKIYHSPLSRKETDKHRVLRSKSSNLKNVAALPISLAFEDALLSKHVGIFIPFVGGSEVFELYGTRSRLQYFPKANFKFLVRAAYNLAVAFEDLHSQGIVVGDVNEQNIKVLPDATVRFIDTDSFQIRNGAELYTTDVGTPLWTAPELHGTNLTGVERTVNHDLFGLAQLIFLILFAGRHPFSGVPKTKQHLLPEEAIKLHAFAFAPLEMGIPVGPPPGSPTLDMLPPEMRGCFLQAFLKNSVRPNARPTADRWRHLLDDLSKELVVCTHNQSHLYWNKAACCPWCAIAREAGVDIFPALLGTAGFSTPHIASNDAYILRLAGIRPHPFCVTTPRSFTGLTPSLLPARPVGFWSGVQQLFSAQGWRQSWLSPSILACKAAQQQSESQIVAARAEQQKIIAAYNQDFSSHAASLAKIIDSLKDISRMRAECLRVVKNERKNVDLNTYLQRFRIRQHKIPQIGPSRLTTILSFGIETAADINQSSLCRTGLPSNAVYELLNWRKQKEVLFSFDPNRSLSAAENQDVERRTQERVKLLREEAASIEVKINEATSRAQINLRPIEAHIHQLARKRDQAKLDLENLERELRRP
jgi:DNA-binding helix-hairpin-helix protein with protein kinase domain